MACLADVASLSPRLPGVTVAGLMAALLDYGTYRVRRGYRRAMGVLEFVHCVISGEVPPEMMDDTADDADAASGATTPREDSSAADDLDAYMAAMAGDFEGPAVAVELSVTAATASWDASFEAAAEAAASAAEAGNGVSSVTDGLE